MSMDRSLKGKNTLERHRNVLTRAERIEHLKELDRWTDDSKAIGLPKIAHRKVSVGKKDKADKEDKEGEAAETTAEAGEKKDEKPAKGA